MIENSEDSFGNFAGEEKESDNVLKDIEVLACFISQDQEGNNNLMLFLNFRAASSSSLSSFVEREETRIPMSSQGRVHHVASEHKDVKS